VRQVATESLPAAVVFIDYQNLFNDARRAFGGLGEPSATSGQINPMKLAYHLVSREPLGASGPRTLKEVRIYRGRPSPSKEPKTYGAHMRQCDAWEKAGAVVIPRPLRYPSDWPETEPEEKGIDVQIAVDIVSMAINEEFDVAILASTDTDLRPPIEAFFFLPFGEGCAIEVAAYRSPAFNKTLRVPDHHVWCHYIEQSDYEALRDRRDYNIKRSK
jgi:uncharacterized LabA/DUF88 family protein